MMYTTKQLTEGARAVASTTKGTVYLTLTLFTQENIDNNNRSIDNTLVHNTSTIKTVLTNPSSCPLPTKPLVELPLPAGATFGDSPAPEPNFLLNLSASALAFCSSFFSWRLSALRLVTTGPPLLTLPPPPPAPGPASISEVELEEEL